jgi:hypothetical protein
MSFTGHVKNGVVPVKIERLPNPPWLDDTIPAPFDLPRPGFPVRVQRRHAERLPELLTEFTEAPYPTLPDN